ncbi:DNA-3-methyladenine glycosylase I [Riemerella columbipharyngis]|uniref:DNA-3-methyladenine glycosylase I n=2 Tax=Riemerella columbipharyngis TaxID=1071918 RepID=A0A1G6ZU76_9FLAO|nr:DNA-3-methyladenine glycosylase I [Riemerella columbipharyngis]
MYFAGVSFLLDLHRVKNMETKRCAWCTKDILYQAYHDEEWGIPVYEDTKLFEFLVLESFQAGLSWLTILKRREYFREAFDGFDYKKIARYSENKVLELLSNEKIIRHKGKISAVINNAEKFQQVQREFGSFSEYLWQFVGGEPIKNHFKTISEIPSATELSDKIAKDLKKRGFRFLGSTTVYAYMQAVGVVDDHTSDCWKRQ